MTQPINVNTQGEKMKNNAPQTFFNTKLLLSILFCASMLRPGTAGGQTCKLVYTNPRTYQVTNEAVIGLHRAGGTNNRFKMEFIIPAPRSWPEMQGPHNEQTIMSPQNRSLPVGHYHFQDTDYLYYWFENVYWNLPDRLSYSYKVQSKNTLLKGKLTTSITDIKNYLTKHSNFNKYLKPSPHLEINNEIFNIRKQIFSKHGNFFFDDPALKFIKCFYDYIYDNAKYNSTNSYVFRGTVDFKRTMYGQCGDYSALLISLCRSIGIPSRPVVGAWLGSNKNSYHVWSEHFLPQVGWLPVDVTVDQGNGQRYQRLGRLEDGNQRIVLSKDYDIVADAINNDHNKLALLQVVGWWWWYSNGQPARKPSVSSNIWGNLVD